MKARALFFVLLPLALLAGCGQDKMANQPRYETYEPAMAWPDNQSARRPPAGTVARDQRIEPPPSHMPMPVTWPLLQRGKTVYEINCVPCHGAVGYGNGMVVRRGFPPPPSYHIERLRQAPPSYIYHVITEGYGVMYSYADRVKPRDRWAVAAYIKALQLSQRTPVQSLDASELAKLGKQQENSKKDDKKSGKKSNKKSKQGKQSHEAQP